MKNIYLLSTEMKILKLLITILLAIIATPAFITGMLFQLQKNSFVRGADKINKFIINL
jgi:hypothetical protein